ncbi:hypothetical protein PG994_003330 [Apiospora phragmitis]|uniref:Uncharacterized protein n=1 Tax=Apiospora phragmitis TaxID=2905665 RepID=A0ABR1VXU0_9PEZI
MSLPPKPYIVYHCRRHPLHVPPRPRPRPLGPRDAPLNVAGLIAVTTLPTARHGIGGGGGGESGLVLLLWLGLGLWLGGLGGAGLRVRRGGGGGGVNDPLVHKQQCGGEGPAPAPAARQQQTAQPSPDPVDDPEGRQILEP